MKRLQWIFANALNVTLSGNDHKVIYWTAKQEFEKASEHSLLRDVPDDVRAICIERDTILQLQIYPNTPVHFVGFTHYDLDELIEAAYVWLCAARKVPPEFSLICGKAQEKGHHDGPSCGGVCVLKTGHDGRCQCVGDKDGPGSCPA